MSKKVDVNDQYLVDIQRKREAELRPTFQQRITYYVIALITSIVPIFLFSSIFGISLTSHAPTFGIVTIFTAAIITFAYHNGSYTIKSRIIDERVNSITVNTFKGEISTNKQAFLDEKRKELAVNTTNESIAFSILFNNLFFLSLLSIFAFFLLPSIGATDIYNYVVSVSASSAIISLTSTLSLN
eukprot:TRINITY_DN15899_c0_g1_i1.p1 TRINITY_DN15899_c0_g1~~TRINITY_DN15899_c0_g1_i1.p1  ORF type:complete len:185 (+),score=37.92 TRINITY_DN15899_c0_g1_i1:36-590(+)